VKIAAVENAVADVLDKIYSARGGSEMNAFTSEDMTVYFVTVPANKLELFLWMESERLLRPVFREETKSKQTLSLLQQVLVPSGWVLNQKRD
jgi:predicted Zn-dependent peptidase